MFEELLFLLNGFNVSAINYFNHERSSRNWEKGSSCKSENRLDIAYRSSSLALSPLLLLLHSRSFAAPRSTCTALFLDDRRGPCVSISRPSWLSRHPFSHRVLVNEEEAGARPPPPSLQPSLNRPRAPLSIRSPTYALPHCSSSSVAADFPTLKVHPSNFARHRAGLVRAIRLTGVRIIARDTAIPPTTRVDDGLRDRCR